jgi:hypothetical protein
MRLHIAILVAGLGLALAKPALAVPPHCPGFWTTRCTITSTVWVPNFFGHGVYRYQYATQIGGPVVIGRPSGNTTFNALPPVDVSTYQCSPSSVAVFNTQLYVVCSSYGAGSPNNLDQILVFDSNLNHVKTIKDPNLNGSGLIGIVFDTHGNLWVTGFTGLQNTGCSGGVLLRVPNKNLNASWAVDTVVTCSPGQPAGIAVSPFDGSFWIVGQYNGGIVVNFPDKALNTPNPSPGNPISPNPLYCVSSSGCNLNATFENPEGVAVAGCATSTANGCSAYYVWVGNNSINLSNNTQAPAKTIERLTSGSTSQPVTYGGTVNKPFACPGGMFSGGQQGPLWVNDEGYGVKNTDCGSTAKDQGSPLGLVLQFPLSNLAPQDKAHPAPWVGLGSAQLQTSSPGFGGIFVDWGS